MAVDTSGIPYPLRGVCYQPAPIDYNGNQGQGQKYFDTDFFNADFEGFWSAANGGRGDLTNMSDLAINFIHLYDWNPPPARDHTGFLSTCAQLGLYLAVPFNNSFCTSLSSWGANAVYAAMEEVYSNNFANLPVVMWTIANEYNQTGSPTPQQIAQVAQVILYYEAQNSVTTILPISSPTSSRRPTLRASRRRRRCSPLSLPRRPSRRRSTTSRSPSPRCHRISSPTAISPPPIRRIRDRPRPPARA